MLPFEGGVRELLIALDAVQFFICIQITVLFSNRGFRNRKSWQENIGWAIVFGIFSILSAFTIYVTYYLPTEIWEENYRIYSLLGLIPVLVVVGLLEYFLQKYVRTRFLYSIITLVFGIMIAFTEGFLSNLFLLIVLIILLIFIIQFFKKLIGISTGIIKFYMILFTVSFIMTMVGNIFRNQSMGDTNLTIEGFIIVEFTARVFQIVGYLTMAVVLFKLPIFFEVNWKENLIQIYIIHRINGIPIFHTSFNVISSDDKKREELDHDLVAGGMVGISTMLKEISKSNEELKIIDHGDQKIILEHSAHVFIALNAKVEMRIYRDKLMKLCNLIEEYYGEILENWDGSLEYFEPLKSIVKNDFI